MQKVFEFIGIRMSSETKERMQDMGLDEGCDGMLSSESEAALRSWYSMKDKRCQWICVDFLCRVVVERENL